MASLDAAHETSTASNFVFAGVWNRNIEQLVSFIVDHGISSAHITECFTQSSSSSGSSHFLFLHSHLEWKASCLISSIKQQQQQELLHCRADAAEPSASSWTGGPNGPRCQHVHSYVTTIVFSLHSCDSGCSPSANQFAVAESAIRVLERMLSIATLFQLDSANRLESFTVESLVFGARSWQSKVDGVLGSITARVCDACVTAINNMEASERQLQRRHSQNRFLGHRASSSLSVALSSAAAEIHVSVACLHRTNMAPLTLSDSDFLAMWPGKQWRLAFSVAHRSELSQLNDDKDNGSISVGALCDETVAKHQSDFSSADSVLQFIDFLKDIQAPTSQSPESHVLSEDLVQLFNQRVRKRRRCDADSRTVHNRFPRGCVRYAAFGVCLGGVLLTDAANQRQSPTWLPELLKQWVAAMDFNPLQNELCITLPSPSINCCSGFICVPLGIDYASPDDGEWAGSSRSSSLCRPTCFIADIRGLTSASFERNCDWITPIALQLAHCAISALSQLQEDYPHLFLSESDRKESHNRNVLLPAIAESIAQMVEVAPPCGAFAREVATILHISSPLTASKVRVEVLERLSSLQTSTRK